METAMNCPVCGLTNIQDNQEKCPQCDAELMCFKVLDSLALNAASVPRKWPAVIITTALAAVLITAASSVYLFYALDRRLSYQETQLNTVVSDLITRQHQDSQLTVSEPKTPDKHSQGQDAEPKPKTPDKYSQGLDAEPEPKTPDKYSQGLDAEPLTEPAEPITTLKEDFLLYHAHDEDTLWGISAKFYGSGYYYPVLLEHNPNIDIFRIKNGVQLRIFNNPTQIRQIYRQIIIREANQRFWLYTVQQGDTLDSIAGRFYRKNGAEELITKHNPELELIPGEKIKILLQ